MPRRTQRDDVMLDEEAKKIQNGKANGPFPPIIFLSIDGTHVKVEPPKKKRKTSALNE